MQPGGPVRLAALLLTLPLLAAPPNRGLPWESEPEPPWRACEPGIKPSMLPDLASPGVSGHRMVSLTPHGVLRIIDERGLVILRLGLPGRPLRIWRDEGISLDLNDFPRGFPVETPLSKGPETLASGGTDFRMALKGLLWILDDGERVITVVHPATGQVAYLRLPGGKNLDLSMYPDRLEVRETDPEPGTRIEAACWSVPWMGLLPQLLLLSTPPPAPPPGTAMNPFPAE